jgi:hypothetical protein
MKHYSGLVGVAIVLAMITSASTANAGAYAGIYKNSKTEIQVFKMFTGAAKGAVTKGKRGHAKLLCVSALNMVWKYLKPGSTFASRHKAAFSAYNAVCEPLYKGHKPDNAGFKAVIAQYKDKLTRYGFALAFEPYGKPRRPLGATGYISSYNRHKRMVDAAMLSPIARAYAVEFVGKLPAPTVLLSHMISHKSRDFDNLPTHLVSIVFGKFAAAQKLKKGGIAKIVSETNTFVKRFSPKMSMGQMLQQVGSATKWIALLRTASPKHPQIAKFDTAVKNVRAAVIKAENAKLAKRRIPKNKYAGKNKAKLLKFVRATYKASYGKYDKVVRVVINVHNWTVPRGAGYWYKKRWYWKVYSKLSPITVAVEQKKAKGKKTYELFQIKLFRERRGKGWSKPYMVGNALHIGSILRKNINK